MKGTMVRGRKGFTLIELLVVIAIIGILAALLFPAVQSAMTRAKGVKVGSDGRQVWQGLYTENTHRAEVGAADVWPDTTVAKSTDYFQTCIKSNILENFSVRSFGAPGLALPTGTNATDLTVDNNAWCITLGCGEGTAQDTPFMFTRNFTGGSTLDGITGLDDAAKPFGGKIGVVVTFGGSMKVLSGKDMRDAASAQKLFNPSDSKLQYVRP